MKSNLILFCENCHSSALKTFYKIQNLEIEIAELKKNVKELESIEEKYCINNQKETNK
jgi:proteasome assembly chaperone (PAC2) family protein